MALGDIVNLGVRFGSGGTATYSPTIAAATAGNLLICYVSVTVANRTCATPAGYTAGPSESAGTAFSSHLFWKEAAGGETAVSMVLSGSGGGYANLIEIDATGADLSALDASATDVTNISTPTASQSTGTAVGTGTSGVAVAFFGVDIGGDVSTGRAYTNSFTEQDTSDMGNTSRGGYLLATKVITGTSNETTFSHTETNQEMFGSIIVFSATAVRGISDIDTDDDVEAGQTSVSITGTDFDASPSTQIATLGGETLTINSWSATVVDVDIPLHIDLKWGSTANTLSLTDDTGTVTLPNVTLSKPALWESVIFNGSIPNPVTTESYYEEAITDLSFTAVVGDILGWETATDLTVDVQTLPTVSPPATKTGDYKFYDISLNTWTSVSTYTWTDGGGAPVAGDPSSKYNINLALGISL